MHGARATTVDSGTAKGSWREIFRDGLGLYSALVIGGIAMNATQMLVIAIIMPILVRDIGGASFYTWAVCSTRSARLSAGPRPAWCGRALVRGAPIRLALAYSRSVPCAVRWRR
jgi:hypothetical protein